VRLYLPATLPRLKQWLSEGEAALGDEGPASLAFAVTPSLREWYREADLEELEHAAQVAASIGSLWLLAADPSAPRRRVILAADLPDEQVAPVSQHGRAAVTLATAVPLKRWGSALVDDVEAGTVVATAIAALGPAASATAGEATLTDDAQFALDEAEAYELGWYAVQELRYLLT
jgi:hypothetical protein